MSHKTDATLRPFLFAFPHCVPRDPLFMLRNDKNNSATCQRHTSRRRRIAFASDKNIVSSLYKESLPGDSHVASLL